MNKRFYYPPVSGVEVYANDLVVIRSRKMAHKLGKRQQIKELSKQSLKRLAFVASNTQTEFRTMLTLTYPSNFPSDGRKVKDDLRKMLDTLRNEWGDFHYLWFLEFQRRGAPHLHVLTDVLPWSWEQLGRERFFISATWYAIVDSGDINHLYAGTRFERLRKADGGKRYAVSYARKPHQKIVPRDYWNVGRFWGYSPGVKPKPIITIPLNERELRQVLEDWEYLPMGDLPKVLYNTSGDFAPLLIRLQEFKDAKEEIDREFWARLTREIADEPYGPAKNG